MIIKEYRFAMPLTLDEYERGQRYSVAKASIAETGGGQGVELLRNEPFESDKILLGQTIKGTYTHKIYHVKDKAPWVVQKALPADAFKIEEKSWNAFPYTKTVLSNPGYMKKDFQVTIETLHSDVGDVLENPLKLSKEILKDREIVYLDIFDEVNLKPADITDTTNPRTFQSKLTGRGPLIEDWSKTAEPRIVVYKVCSVYFKWFGLQKKVESSFHKNYPRLFTKFNREMFCWIDLWHGLSAAELAEYEKTTAAQLAQNFKSGKVVGMKANDDPMSE